MVLILISESLLNTLSLKNPEIVTVGYSYRLTKLISKHLERNQNQFKTIPDFVFE